MPTEQPTHPPHDADALAVVDGVDVAEERAPSAPAAAVPGAPGAPMAVGASGAGLLYAVGAYVSWGLFPIYFKAILRAGATPMEALTHRVVWGVWVVAGMLLWFRRWGEVRAAIRTPRTLRLLACTTVLIAFNWYLYAWAVASNHVLEGSLGYFINPLVNVAFGVLLLKERLTRGQRIALVLACAGVLVFAFAAGRPPWISLALAASFASYALLRKRAHVHALPGLMVETALLFPLALGYLVWLHALGRSAFLRGSGAADVLLVLAGVVTVVPLLWFTEGARRLTLTTLGLLQYIAPTGQFLLAVLLYGEPFSPAKGVAFALIWAGLAIVSVEAIGRAKRDRSARIDGRRAPGAS